MEALRSPAGAARPPCRERVRRRPGGADGPVRRQPRPPRPGAVPRHRLAPQRAGGAATRPRAGGAALRRSPPAGRGALSPAPVAVRGGGAGSRHPQAGGPLPAGAPEGGGPPLAARSPRPARGHRERPGPGGGRGAPGPRPEDAGGSPRRIASFATSRFPGLCSAGEHTGPAGPEGSGRLRSADDRRRLRRGDRRPRSTGGLRAAMERVVADYRRRTGLSGRVLLPE